LGCPDSAAETFVAELVLFHAQQARGMLLAEGDLLGYAGAVGLDGGDGLRYNLADQQAQGARVEGQGNGRCPGGGAVGLVG
jgi:hypothetical protein